MTLPSGHRRSPPGDAGSSGPSTVLPSSGKGSWGSHPVNRNIRTNEAPGQQTKQEQVPVDTLQSTNRT